MAAKPSRKPARRRVFLVLLLLVSAGLSFLVVVAPQLAPFSPSSLQAGQVAPQDFLAPRDISYESQVLTEQAREAAARAVSSVYTTPDTSTARQQLERLRSVIAFISSVRADGFSTPEQKVNDLAAIEDVRLSRQTIEGIVALNDQRWQAAQQEAIAVLEQVMRSTIRDDRLDDARRSVPSLVSLALPEDQAAIVAELAAAFVVPNSFYNEVQTQAARESARQSVTPLSRSYQAGETVVQRGQVITDTALEALQKLGLVQIQDPWKPLLSAAALIFLEMTFLMLYLRRNTRLLIDLRGLTVIACLFLVFLAGARLLTDDSLTLAYVFPLAAYSLTIAALFGANPAIVTSLLLAALASYQRSDALVLMLYYILGSFFGIMLLGKAQRVISFFWAGLAIAASGALVTIAYTLPDPGANILEIATLSGAALLNGIASASLALLLQFFLAQILGMTTALQLMELSRPDHPLLQLLLRSSPGTYQHSLQVANLAEQAAEAIGADTLLTRVGAQYHDVGKSINAMFFIENQVQGNNNPHETLDPLESAQIIIRHIPDGVELARRHRIPERIQDFIREHHGTMIARYQYYNAVKAAGGDEGKVSQELFRYPGPAPRSRETAILMLADGSEARVRAERPQDEATMKEVIKSLIQNRLSSGQLDNTGLTLHDLETIADSFTSTLRGIYHPRIEYPALDKITTYSQDPNPTVPSPLRTPPEAPAPASPEVNSAASQGKS
jgi:putative nucleotidyltransferase with HDIG domain